MMTGCYLAVLGDSPGRNYITISLWCALTPNYWDTRPVLKDQNARLTETFSKQELDQLRLAADAQGLRTAVLFRLLCDAAVQRAYVTPLTPAHLGKTGECYSLRVTGSQ